MITWRKVVIKGIEFDGPIHLSHSDVARIITQAIQKDLNADDLDWIKGFVEIGLRDAWQNHGYFKVNVSAKASSLGGNSSEERFLVTAHVEEGLKYYLRNIRFVGNSLIPEVDLRAAVPLKDGEVFNVGLIRSGIGALTKLYDSKGYIDFTAAPETDVDDDLRPRISLVFYLDEQKQYRVGKVETVALDPRLEAPLRTLLKSGEIFNPEAVEPFFKQNKSVLPPGWSSNEDMLTHRNVQAGIADLTFDFRHCP